MDSTEKILRNKQYMEQLDELSNETLTLIANDPIKALEVAQKGIEQVEPEKINDVEYLQVVADAMQKLAQKVLKLRSVNSSI